MHVILQMCPNIDWIFFHIRHLCTVAQYQVSRSYFCKIVLCVCKRLAVPSVSEIAPPDDWKRLMDSIVGLAGSVEQNKLWFSTWNKSSDRLADKSSRLQRLIEFLHRTNCSSANQYISANHHWKPVIKYFACFCALLCIMSLSVDQAHPRNVLQNKTK